MKKKIENFFLKNRFGKWLFNGMAILNGIEGVIHLVVATIGTIGVFSVFGFKAITNLLFINGVSQALTTWAVMLPNIENFIFGVFSILVGLALGAIHHHHHHKH